MWKALTALTFAMLAAGGGRQVQFVDIAKSAGLTAANTFGGRDKKQYILESTGNGTAIFDYDGDGDNDLFIANGTTLKQNTQDAPPVSHLYRNDGKGNFALASAEAGFTRQGWAQGVCAADYDNDGRTDLLVTYYGSNSLYRNLGGGRFSDVAEKAGLTQSTVRWGAGCSFVDYDRDGYVDLFVSNYVDLDLEKTPLPGQDASCQWKGVPVWCGPQGLPAARNVLYRNQGDGTFADVSEQAGILKPGTRYGLGVVAADFDNDGWPDIYVACDMTPSLLFQNQKNGTFKERGVEAGVAYNFDGRLQAGMGVAASDFNGDGFIDLVKTNFSGDLPSLYKNEDGRFFSDISREAGLGNHQLLGWGVLFIDLDEDGRKDLVMANGHVYPEVDKGAPGDRYLQQTLVYRNLGDSRFSDITAEAGPAFQALRPARGAASGDLDGDGRPEIVLVNMNERPSLLKNRAPGQGFLLVKLIGVKSNRSAIGARVTIHTGSLKQTEEVQSGSSFYSQNDLRLHFGLGTLRSPSRIEVRWPDGQVQRWSAIPPNRLVTLTEGSAEAAY